MKPNTHKHVDPRNHHGSRWRSALMALAMPATRMHKYRNLHKTMFYERMCELDCKDC
jgi:hypothetical protein